MQPEACTHLCCFLCLTCSQDCPLCPQQSLQPGTHPASYPVSFSLTGLRCMCWMRPNSCPPWGFGSCWSLCTHFPATPLLSFTCLAPITLQITLHLPLFWVFKELGCSPSQHVCQLLWLTHPPPSLGSKCTEIGAIWIPSHLWDTNMLNTMLSKYLLNK